MFAFGWCVMDERLVAACKKLVVMGGVVGLSVDDLLTLLLNGTSVDQLLDLIQERLDRIMEPIPSRWVM
jgi:uncharacterized protein YfaQ (DUF2300 family)